MGLFEEASDCVGCHVGLLCFRCQVGAIKDCNDGDEGNCIGKGNLRVLVPSQTHLGPQGAPMAMVALVAFSVSNLNLISISAQAKASEIDNNLGMKKNSIDGNTQIIYESLEGS